MFTLDLSSCSLFYKNATCCDYKNLLTRVLAVNCHADMTYINILHFITVFACSSSWSRCENESGVAWYRISHCKFSICHIFVAFFVFRLALNGHLIDCITFAGNLTFFLFFLWQIFFSGLLLLQLQVDCTVKEILMDFVFFYTRLAYIHRER